MTIETQDECIPQSSPSVRNAVSRKYRQLPWPRSVRLPVSLDEDVTRYLEQNSINFNQLCTFALQKFVAERQILELLPVSAPLSSPESDLAALHRAHEGLAND